MLGRDRRRAHLFSTPVGFTLLESLVALAIISLSLIGGLKLSQVTVNSLREAQLRSLGLLCADNEVVRIRVSPLLQIPGVREGSCAQAQHQFKVASTITDTPHRNFRRLVVQVRQSGNLLLAERIVLLPIGF